MMKMRFHKTELKRRIVNNCEDDKIFRSFVGFQTDRKSTAAKNTIRMTPSHYVEN